MRIAYLTAGAGDMLCGSCMRDNTLAAALIRQRRDVVLIPVYSPIRTDEENVSTQRVVFGGINVFLQQQFPRLSKFSGIVDRILDHPALLKRAMKKAGSTAADVAAPYTLSILRGEDGAQKREVEKLIGHLRDMKPDLVHLPDAFFIGLAAPIRRALNIPVVCTLTGEDILLEKLPPAARDEAFRIIRDRGRAVDGYLCVTRYYAGYARERFGIEADRIHHVPLGISLTGPAQDSNALPGFDATSNRPFTIGYLARICHEKGLHQLIEALAILHTRGRKCRLLVAGYLGDSDQPYFKSVQRDVHDRGLSEWVEFLGEVDRTRKFQMLRSIDLFSVPTVYREAKGIYVLEAMSQGVPVVQPAHGSFTEIIEATGGGLLFEPHSSAALAGAITQLMDEPDRRRALGDAGQTAVHSHFTDAVMAQNAWRAFELIASNRSAARDA